VTRPTGKEGADRWLHTPNRGERGRKGGEGSGDNDPDAPDLGGGGRLSCHVGRESRGAVRWGAVAT
jgi:hypothetical protein